jgi:ribonuclease BN (tRNA processing enzyme)
MSKLRFLCLGVGDAFSDRWYSSSLAVECDGTWILVDCPHPIRKILREASEAAGLSLDLGRISGLIQTHLHADHASGLEGYGFFNHFVLQRKAVVLTHPDVERDLWDRHLRATMGSILPAPGAELKAMKGADFFDVKLLSESAAASFGPFQIECRRTIHHIPTFALRIRAGGRTLALSADTAYDPGLIDWLSEGDLIVHETNFGIHTPYERLAALPEALRRRMRLIHYPDDFDLKASVIEPLIPGRFYEV